MKNRDFSDLHHKLYEKVGDLFVSIRQKDCFNFSISQHSLPLSQLNMADQYGWHETCSHSEGSFF